MIRDANESDLALIVAIYNAAIPGRMATADTVAVPVASRVEWFRQHSADKHPLWVFERDHQVAAWLSFSSFYGRPAYAATAELSVYVAPEFRRHGLARTLLKRAVDRAPDLRLKTLVGFIFAHNEPSLQLFDAFGFRRWGELPRVALLDGVERDLVIVGRRVP